MIVACSFLPICVSRADVLFRHLRDSRSFVLARLRLDSRRDVLDSICFSRLWVRFGLFVESSRTFFRNERPNGYV